jgi:hypothetical protein
MKTTALVAVAMVAASALPLANPRAAAECYRAGYWSR